jgi:hypothetical protein
VSDSPYFDAGEAQSVDKESLDVSVHETEDQRVDGTVEEYHPVHQPRHLQRHLHLLRVVLKLCAVRRARS